ncbi:hypothetical protein [Sansalvadorimonas verongulae]|nr:hypothetical protein [Sansalvadorimonas verongulae]
MPNELTDDYYSQLEAELAEYDKSLPAWTPELQELYGITQDDMEEAG